MDRTERLLDLVALLLDAQEPVSWAELKEAFPEDYGSGTDEATERKFERDKAELLELGIPLTYVQGDEDRKDGYLLDRDAYYLPDVRFTPEEMAVLYAAGSAALASGAFPGRQDLQHALRKIGFFADPNLPAPRVRMELGAVREARHVPQHLEALWTAASTRKSVTLVYASPTLRQALAPHRGPLRTRASAGHLVSGGLLSRAPGAPNVSRPPHSRLEDEPEQAAHCGLPGAGRLPTR